MQGNIHPIARSAMQPGERDAMPSSLQNSLFNVHKPPAAFQIRRKLCITRRYADPALSLSLSQSRSCPLHAPMPSLVMRLNSHVCKMRGTRPDEDSRTACAPLLSPVRAC